MFEKYVTTSEYQDHILACIIKHPEKFTCYRGILDYTFFTGNPRIATARAMFSYCKEYNRYPTWDVLVQRVYEEIGQSPDSKDEKSIMDYLKRIEKTDTKDVESIAKYVVTFARQRSAWLVFEETFREWQAGKFQFEKAYARLQEAERIGVNLEDIGDLIGPGQDATVIGLVERMVDEKRALKFGAAWNHLDEVWQDEGGIGHWLVSILAPPKRYKTTFCVNLGLNICMGGQPVFYYPCEITQKDALTRIYQSLTDRTKSFIRKRPGDFAQLGIRLQNELMRAPMLVKGYPMRQVSIAKQIRDHALNAVHQLGIKPKAIFIDHAECLLCSSTKRDISDHRAQGEIYIEGHNLALEMECPVFLPDRCNAETVDRIVPGMRAFQGAFEKGGHVDATIALCATEQEHLNNQLRYFLLFNRHGAAGLHWRGTVAPSTWRMTIDEIISWNPEEDEANAKGGGKQPFKRPHKRRPVDSARVLDDRNS